MKPSARIKRKYWVTKKCSYIIHFCWGWCDWCWGFGCCCVVTWTNKTAQHKEMLNWSCLHILWLEMINTWFLTWGLRSVGELLLFSDSISHVAFYQVKIWHKRHSDWAWSACHQAYVISTFILIQPSHCVSTGSKCWYRAGEPHCLSVSHFSHWWRWRTC